jgi:plasmid stabilization system protein ParE
MEAAKAVEHTADASTSAATGGDEPSLETVRAAVAAVSDQLIHELARSATSLHDPAARDRLDEALRTGLQSPAAVPYVTRMVEAIQRLKPAAEQVPVP